MNTPRIQENQNSNDKAEKCQHDGPKIEEKVIGAYKNRHGTVVFSCDLDDLHAFYVEKGKFIYKLQGSLITYKCEIPSEEELERLGKDFYKAQSLKKSLKRKLDEQTLDQIPGSYADDKGKIVVRIELANVIDFKTRGNILKIRLNEGNKITKIKCECPSLQELKRFSRDLNLLQQQKKQKQN